MTAPAIKQTGTGVPWFPVDDAFHSHPKVLATSLAALGLWAKAGSWCMDPAHITDGRVPAHVLASLGDPDAQLAEELVTTGLWRRTRKGYVFHDWFETGNKRTAKQQRELSKVRAANGRLGGLARGQNLSKVLNEREANGPVDKSATPHGPPSDLRKGPSKPEANPKQLASPLVRGGLNPNTSTKEHPPNPPPSGGHDGSHPNCRACGTNRRGPPAEPPSTPMPPAYQRPNGRGRVASEDVADVLAKARAAIGRKEDSRGT